MVADNMDKLDKEPGILFPKLLTFYLICPQCNKIFYVNHYTVEGARKVLETFLVKHSKICFKKEKESQIFLNKDIREIAEEHWKYTLGIIERVMIAMGEDIEYSKSSIELMHYLYVEAMIHGWKHCEDELKSHGYYNEKEIQE